MILNRYLLNTLKKYINMKILLISGPRQSGKTILARNISKNHDYINLDYAKDRILLEEQSWNRNKSYIIFDELHKKTNWKRWLKGIFDVEGIPPGLVVTGSAKLDTYKKVGDSMAGRFFSFRLYPFDLKELIQVDKSTKNPEKILDNLLLYSGFPEPYLKRDKAFYNLWEKTHIDTIITQDLITLESPKNILKIQTLIELLKERIGTPISYSDLAEKLGGCSHKTVQQWMQWLENLYIIFKVVPYSKKVTNSLRKKPKYYFYNWVLIKKDHGLMFENFIACSLLKQNHCSEDTKGEKNGLFYLRDKNKKEIDFLLTKDDKPMAMIETKWSQETLSSNFKVFSKYFKNIKKIQLVKNLRKEKTYPDSSEVRKASKWLVKML